jgi:hypothetical protein
LPILQAIPARLSPHSQLLVRTIKIILYLAPSKLRQWLPRRQSQELPKPLLFFKLSKTILTSSAARITIELLVFTVTKCSNLHMVCLLIAVEFHSVLLILPKEGSKEIGFHYSVPPPPMLLANSGSTPRSGSGLPSSRIKVFWCSVRGVTSSRVSTSRCLT